MLSQIQQVLLDSLMMKTTSLVPFKGQRVNFPLWRASPSTWLECTCISWPLILVNSHSCLLSGLGGFTISLKQIIEELMHFLNSRRHHFIAFLHLTNAFTNLIIPDQSPGFFHWWWFLITIHLPSSNIWIIWLSLNFPISSKCLMLSALFLLAHSLSGLKFHNQVRVFELPKYKTRS